MRERGKRGCRKKKKEGKKTGMGRSGAREEGSAGHGLGFLYLEVVVGEVVREARARARRDERLS